MPEETSTLFDAPFSGSRTREITGDDYEFRVTVTPKYREKVLLGLMQEAFSSISGSSDFEEWLKKRGIPYERFVHR